MLKERNQHVIKRKIAKRTKFYISITLIERNLCTSNSTYLKCSQFFCQVISSLIFFFCTFKWKIGKGRKAIMLHIHITSNLTYISFKFVYSFILLNNMKTACNSLGQVENQEEIEKKLA